MKKELLCGTWKKPRKYEKHKKQIKLLILNIAAPNGLSIPDLVRLSQFSYTYVTNIVRELLARGEIIGKECREYRSNGKRRIMRYHPVPLKHKPGTAPLFVQPTASPIATTKTIIPTFLKVAKHCFNKTNGRRWNDRTRRTYFRVCEKFVQDMAGHCPITKLTLTICEAWVRLASPCSQSARRTVLRFVLEFAEQEGLIKNFYRSPQRPPRKSERHISKPEIELEEKAPSPKTCTPNLRAVYNSINTDQSLQAAYRLIDEGYHAYIEPRENGQQAFLYRWDREDDPSFDYQFFFAVAKVNRDVVLLHMEDLADYSAQKRLERAKYAYQAEMAEFVAGLEALRAKTEYQRDQTREAKPTLWARIWAWLLYA